MSRTKNRHPKGHKPPVPPQRLLRWADFPDAPKSAKYSVDGDTTTVTGKSKNRVLRALINGPAYCASPVRIGMFVHLLREKHGLSIRTDEYSADNADQGGFGAYGTYTLETPVTQIEGEDAA